MNCSKTVANTHIGLYERSAVKLIGYTVHIDPANATACHLAMTDTL